MFAIYASARFSPESRQAHFRPSLSGMLPPRPLMGHMVAIMIVQFEIFSPVIVLHTVQVVDNFFGFQIPTYFLLHYETVFPDVP